MMLRTHGAYRYGDAQADIREELVAYSIANAYLAAQFADARCLCGNRVFALRLDEDEGVAVRMCQHCRAAHPIGDSAAYLADAQLEDCECVCGASAFEITVGVALYPGSADVRWLYVGCRCPACGLTACYGDWKNEYEGYHALLANV